MKKQFLLLCFLGALYTQLHAQCVGFGMTITGNNPTCYQYIDGSLTVIATGGNGGNIYTITDALGTTLNLGNSITANQLGDGWYYAHVIDNMACEIVDSIFIDEPAPMSIDIYPFQQASFGQQNGYVVIDTVYNYTGNYNMIGYYWNPNPSGLNGLGADSCGQLGADDYVLIINDEFGCSITADITVEELPEFLFYDLVVTHNTTTTDGEVFCVVQGGTNTYDYLWTNLQTSATMNAASWSGLTIGQYSIKVTDGNGDEIIETVELGYLDLDKTNSEQLTVYPTIINAGIVQLNNQLSTSITFVVYNAIGQKVFQTTVAPGKTELPLSLENGTYFYQTLDNNIQIKEGRIIVAQ